MCNVRYIFSYSVIIFVVCSLGGLSTIVVTVNIERGVAVRTSEVSGLRFDCVLTVCSMVKLGILLGSRQHLPQDPPQPPPPRRLLSGPSRAFRCEQYGPPRDQQRAFGSIPIERTPLNDRNACRRISFISAPSSTHPDPSSISCSHPLSFHSRLRSVTLLRIFVLLDLFSS